MPRSKVFPILCLFAGLSLATTGPGRTAPPEVAADIAPVQSLVARVMQGSGAAPTLILPPAQSPHHAAMRPSQARALAQAALMVRVGPGLSPALDRAVSAASPATVLSLIDLPGGARLPLRTDPAFGSHDHDDHGHDDQDDHAAHSDHEEAGDAGHDEDHAHGDGHDHEDAHGHEDGHDDTHAQSDAGDHDEAVGDAHGHADDVDLHAWLDPVNAAVWLDGIADQLAALDPDNAALYRTNAAAGQAELALLGDSIAARLAPVAGGRFVLLHDATGYFETRFGLQAAGSLSTGDAAMPGPARLAAIRELIATSGAACLIAEPQHDKALVERLSAETGVPVVTIDPLGAGLEPGATLYPALLEALAAGFDLCLAG